ncbi:GTPase regulator [Schizosaccharomyces japonicus yFS275]|uniref:GTPase regulator n=1 Tax=Schizosaccharomyces japonicus (strain yFS275 / FY16936) TaxID=402676 RepID=B6K5V4_SCHJY|nr:GTPase regulator [Schizosaccharomyces japonicus yFS275]EEB08908.1 GTPase regulator [Schizosaccharomyces japonicus yFS275]
MSSAASRRGTIARIDVNITSSDNPRSRIPNINRLWFRYVSFHLTIKYWVETLVRLEPMSQKAFNLLLKNGSIFCRIVILFDPSLMKKYDINACAKERRLSFANMFLEFCSTIGIKDVLLQLRKVIDFGDQFLERFPALCRGYLFRKHNRQFSDYRVRVPSGKMIELLLKTTTHLPKRETAKVEIYMQTAYKINLKNVNLFVQSYNILATSDVYKPGATTCIPHSSTLIPATDFSCPALYNNMVFALQESPTIAASFFKALFSNKSSNLTNQEANILIAKLFNFGLTEFDRQCFTKAIIQMIKDSICLQDQKTTENQVRWAARVFKIVISPQFSKFYYSYLAEIAYEPSLIFPKSCNDNFSFRRTSFFLSYLRDNRCFLPRELIQVLHSIQNDLKGVPQSEKSYLERLFLYEQFSAVSLIASIKSQPDASSTLAVEMQRLLKECLLRNSKRDSHKELSVLCEKIIKLLCNDKPVYPSLKYADRYICLTKHDLFCLHDALLNSFREQAFANEPAFESLILKLPTYTFNAFQRNHMVTLRVSHEVVNCKTLCSVSGVFLTIANICSLFCQYRTNGSFNCRVWMDPTPIEETEWRYSESKLDYNHYWDKNSTTSDSGLEPKLNFRSMVGCQQLLIDLMSFISNMQKVKVDKYNLLKFLTHNVMSEFDYKENVKIAIRKLAEHCKKLDKAFLYHEGCAMDKQKKAAWLGGKSTKSALRTSSSVNEVIRCFPEIRPGDILDVKRTADGSNYKFILVEQHRNVKTEIVRMDALFQAASSGQVTFPLLGLLFDTAGLYSWTQSEFETNGHSLPSGAVSN